MNNNSVAGIPFPREIPEGFIPLDGVVVLKLMDPEGQIRIWTAATGSLSVFEAYGMVELARRGLSAGFDRPETPSY